MNHIYKRAQAAFEKFDSRNPTAPQGKVFQMGFMDGYLMGFREAKGMEEKQVNSHPNVTVIIPHHLNANHEYLQWCVKSVLASVDVNLHVIVISDAEQGRLNFRDARVHSVWDISLSNLTKKWNKGLELVGSESEYVMLISDDVMVSKYAIGDMARAIGGEKWILSPGSNCDSTTRFYTNYFLSRGVEGDAIKLNHKSTLGEIKGYEQSVIDYPRGPAFLIDPGWVSFYCTMFPKSVLSEVGEFDENLDVRYNDVDYCQRARKLGIPSLIHLGAFALHFGDKTLPACTTQAQYAAADEAYRQKYAPQVKL